MNPLRAVQLNKNGELPLVVDDEIENELSAQGNENTTTKRNIELVLLIITATDHLLENLW